MLTLNTSNEDLDPKIQETAKAAALSYMNAANGTGSSKSSCSNKKGTVEADPLEINQTDLSKSTNEISKEVSNGNKVLDKNDDEADDNDSSSNKKIEESGTPDKSLNTSKDLFGSDEEEDVAKNKEKNISENEEKEQKPIIGQLRLRRLSDLLTENSSSKNNSEKKVAVEVDLVSDQDDDDEMCNKKNSTNSVKNKDSTKDKKNKIDSDDDNDGKDNDSEGSDNSSSEEENDDDSSDSGKLLHSLTEHKVYFSQIYLEFLQFLFHQFNSVLRCLVLL